MKSLQVFITSNLQKQIDPDLASILLAMLIPLFSCYMFDLFVIKIVEIVNCNISGFAI